MKEILNIKLYSTAETAKMLDVTEITVRNYFKQGKMIGQKIGGGLYFSEGNIKDFLCGKKKNKKRNKVTGKMDEKVLCVPAGLTFDDFDKFVDDKHLFLVRKYAEHNAGYRHIIPYCVMMAPNSKRILAYQRKGGNEKRLDGQWSIGIGGHVHPHDGKGFQAVINARDRECMEEIGVTPHKTFGEIYIQLNETEVDRVHLGFCQIVTEWHGDFRASEEIPEWEMLTIPQLREKNLETWAVYVLDLLESDWGDLLGNTRKSPASYTGRYR